MLLATALVVALYTVVRLGRREGLDTGRLVDFSTWIIITALLGAKVLLILTEWTFYSQHPGQIFSVATLEAGGVFYGGFVAATFFFLVCVSFSFFHLLLPLTGGVLVFLWSPCH